MLAQVILTTGVFSRSLSPAQVDDLPAQTHLIQLELVGVFKQEISKLCWTLAFQGKKNTQKNIYAPFMWTNVSFDRGLFVLDAS